MSQRTEQVEESSRFDDSTLDLLEDWYHVPVLAALFAFMLWVRLQSFNQFIRGGEVFYSGNDAWYHLRQVTYTVHHWPQTMPFDPWTYFPYGTSVGQFGTLYDQLVATAALVIGLGDPSQKTIALTLLVAPAVFGALAAVPTYYIGKRLGGRFAGLFGVLILALFPGTFLSRSLVGAADHNGAEPVFQATAVLVTMIAIAVAEREKPVFELVADRDFEALRRPFGWSVLAGVATAMYLWMWPPGVLLVGILGVFYLLKLTADYLRGVSPDHLAFVAAVSMSVTGLLLFVPFGTASFSATKFSLLQPVFALLVAVGSIFMAWLAREWDARDASPALYPVAIFGILAVGILFTREALPDVFTMVKANLVRFIGFGQGAQSRTIGEAQPLLGQVNSSVGIQWYDVIMRQYGLMFFTAIAGALVVLWRAFAADEHDGERLLVLVWAAFITSAAFTQVRFNYYLVVPVAALNAFLIGWVFDVIDLSAPSVDDLRNIEGYQVLAVVFVVLLIVPVLVVPAGIGQVQGRQYQTSTAMEVGSGDSPDAITEWDGTLDWMSKNTPKEGTYGGANDSMNYYGTYAEDDGDFDYPNGAYGVMSWWDYGHWITVEGERIPNANPFQEGARTAAQYLLAPSEQQANNVIQQMGNGEQTRFVMVDWKMASTNSNSGGKFFAPIVFNDDVNTSDFYSTVYRQTQNRYQPQFQLKNQRYYESQMIRLYKYHGSAVEPQPIVVDYARVPPYPVEQVKQFPRGENASVIRTNFSSMAEAREFVRQDGTAQIGGISGIPSERVPALEHYRLVKASQSDAPTRGGGAWVKAFERVPGATVEGTAPANTTVTASVTMQMPARNGNFTYTQQAQTGDDGTFTMTLPYSTTGYDEWGPKNGHTNVSVRATGPYEFTTNTQATDEGFTYWNATADVSEAQVNGEDDSPVTVSVDNKHVLETEGAQNNSTNGSSAAGSSSLPSNGSTLRSGGSDDAARTNGGGEPTTDSYGRYAADTATRAE